MAGWPAFIVLNWAYMQSVSRNLYKTLKKIAKPNKIHKKELGLERQQPFAEKQTENQKIEKPRTKVENNKKLLWRPLLLYLPLNCLITYTGCIHLPVIMLDWLVGFPVRTDYACIPPSLIVLPTITG